ncbi:nicotinamide/nicotinic acid mononucleotide adenylyltransferase 3-like isoform X2 [Rhagoletis pomonella]|uniref:nicotinamide/nicotinic acid mononucleotide adenylyltransferase 3-like isoform X2 n=1 Tax=Rhagoletis pomonella TaxID=28610 RepID=UPI00178084CD|nr:nicotinamide/nicotinic acid mononucleotide adenylyltransferase 3-like isoform X2 [Rhagoletis pomonella]
MSVLIEDEQMNNQRLLPRIALIACGSFSPPTPMHFRMFEIARDYFTSQGSHHVVGGIVSPTHDSYQKKGLVGGTYRFAMLKLALQSSTWIRASDWEIQQPEWSRTLSVLQYHQNYMNNYVNSPIENEINGTIPGWLPPGLRERQDGVQLKLLCGADLLESFAVPGLWADKDIEDIVGNHGLVVITRYGSSPEKFIFESDLLTKYQKNITLITNWVPNEVSSTMIRRLISRGQSVKYLLDDRVIDYIQMQGLFNCKTFNLDNRKPSSMNVFCCGESEVNAPAKKLLPSRNGPGQVVQVVTSERGKKFTTDIQRTSSGMDESDAKKIKTDAVNV